MKRLTFKRSRFDLTKFLDALHRFSLDHTGGGNPLPGLSGGTVYFDNSDLIEALASDVDEEVEDVPGGSLERLEMGLSVFGYFALCDGWGAFECADGQEIEVPDLDDEDEDDEPDRPRKRRTKQ